MIDYSSTKEGVKGRIGTSRCRKGGKGAPWRKGKEKREKKKEKKERHVELKEAKVERPRNGGEREGGGGMEKRKG